MFLAVSDTKGKVEEALKIIESSSIWLLKWGQMDDIHNIEIVVLSKVTCATLFWRVQAYPVLSEVLL